MRIEDGRWVCEQCGAVVEMPLDDPWHTEIQRRAGQPNVRIVVAGGREVHRCEVSAAAHTHVA